MYNPNFTGNPQQLIAAGTAAVGTVLSAPAVAVGVAAVAAVAGIAYLIKKKEDKEKDK